MYPPSSNAPSPIVIYTQSPQIPKRKDRFRIGTIVSIIAVLIFSGAGYLLITDTGFFFGVHCGAYRWDPDHPVFSTASFSCPNNNVLIKAQENASFDNVVFWRGSSFPNSYTVQVTITLNSPNPVADPVAGIIVHTQVSGSLLFGSNYSGYLFAASPHDWVVGVHTGLLTSRVLDEGSLILGNTFTLKVHVQGPVMNFFINGTPISTVTDATLASTQAIGLDFSGFDSSQSPSALFSQFSFSS